MVDATKGLFISCDIPMAQFIINLNASMPSSQKFIVHVLDSTHFLVQPDVAGMIRSAISDFRDQNSYEKPSKDMKPKNKGFSMYEYEQLLTSHFRFYIRYCHPDI
ncbi:hypothetical protein CRYUN_Cryun19dG0135400 [Craigia yunnanensis]